MRLRKVVLAILLLAMAALLAGVNIWFTAARSTIPLALDTQVLGKEMRPEKHAGKDDVYLLELRGIGKMQVDHEIYEALAVGDTLQKRRHSRELLHNGKVLPLDWSRDYRGMLTAMPMCLAIFAALVGKLLVSSVEGATDHFPWSGKS